MRNKLFIPVLIAGLAAASEAMAQYCELEKLHVSSQGDGVSADFSSVDTSTCAAGVETTIHVEGSQGLVSQADLCGRGSYHIRTVTETQTSVVAVFISVYDRCVGAELFSIAGTGEAEHFHLSNNFKTASLRATIEAVDNSDNPVPVEIDLVWSAVGQKDRTVDHDGLHQGIHKYVYTSTGTTRSATASGSVMVDGTDETPLPSTQGTLERDVFHEFIVYR